MRPRTASWAKVTPLLVVLVAFALRLYRLGAQSFAFDEGWTSYAIHHSWAGIWGALIPDNHPPLYYVLVKAFADLAGYTDLPLRFFSVICGTALVAALWALGARLFGPVAGIAASLVGASLPSLVYYSQEARMYSLLMALAASSLYSMARMVDQPTSRGWWAAYVITTSAALYTHYFAVLLLVAQNVAWMMRAAVLLARAGGSPHWASTWRLIRPWVLGQLTILLLYLPWLPTAIHQVRIGQGTWWRMPLPPSIILRDIWRFFLMGPRRPLGVPVFSSLTGPTALAVLVGVGFGWRQHRWSWLLVLTTMGLPIALIVMAGARLPVYTNRYALVALAGLPLLTGLGVSACGTAIQGRGSWLGRLSGFVLLATAVAGPLPHLRALYSVPKYWREDFRRAAEYLMHQSGPGDTVVLLGSSPPILHYYHGQATVLRFPQQGDSVQSEEEVISLLRKHVQPGHTVRVVMYSWPTVDPQGLTEGQLRAQCAFRGEHWQTETGERPIRVLNFADCGTQFAREARMPIAAVWDEQVALSAYRTDVLMPGQRSYVVLWWKALRRPDQDYSVFVHLLGSDGRMLAQFDKLPLSDFYPMRAWPLQVDHRDAYPLQVPESVDLEGAYLAIGLYDSHTGQRLPVRQDGAPAGDALRIPVTR